MTLHALHCVGKSEPVMFRWGSHVSLLAILLALFVIPHDPSSSLDPGQVGSSAMRAPSSVGVSRGPRGAAVSPPRTSELASRSPRVAPVAMQGASALLRPANSVRHSSIPLADLDEEWRRLVRCATCKPKATARVVVNKAKTISLTRSFSSEGSSSSSSSRGAVGVAKRATSLMPEWGFYRQQQEGAAAAADDATGAAGRVSSANASAWQLYTTVEELRAAYGEGRTLSASQTRELYHSLLPTQLLEVGDESTLAERAELAIKARHAARLYARERAALPVTLSSELMDGVRTLLKQGNFQRGGLSEEQIWQKYAGCSSPHEVDCLDNEVYYTILRKACTSNQHVDKFCLTLASSAAGWTVGGLGTTVAAAAASSLGRSLQDTGI